MIPKKSLMIIAICLCLLLTACGFEISKSEKKSAGKDTETTENEEKTNENETDLDNMEVALTIEEIIEEDGGKYSGNQYNEPAVHRDLDEKNFQDKDSFQVYNHLLSILNESSAYKEYVSFAEEFNPTIETSLSEIPDGANVEQSLTDGSQTNIVILLDASGSMAAKNGGKTRMETAKEAIKKFVSSMPENANVSLRVYGHKGSNKDSDKKMSCDSTELLYDLKPYNEADFQNSLDKFQPTGWTPIAKAINETRVDFEKGNTDGENIIYVVSDGIETCDGDPVKAAKDLHDSNIKAVINIIGFDVDDKGQKQLLAVAEAGGGSFETVKTAEQFNELWEKERVRLYSEWSKWIYENYNEVSSESANKQNELHSKKGDFINTIYQEAKRLNDTMYYLRKQEQITSDTLSEVSSLIQQRKDILLDYNEEKYQGLIDEFIAESERVRNEIHEKGQEKRDQYSN